MQLFTVFSANILVTPSNDSVAGTTYDFPSMRFVSIVLFIPSMIGGVLLLKRREVGVVISAIALIAWIFTLLSSLVPAFIFGPSAGYLLSLSLISDISKTISSATMLIFLLIGMWSNMLK